MARRGICARLQSNFSVSLCQSRERGWPRDRKRTSRQSGRGRSAGIEAVYLHREMVGVGLTPFPNTSSHSVFKRAGVVLKLGLMLMLVSNLCDIQSQVTMTAWCECRPGFSPKYVAS